MQDPIHVMHIPREVDNVSNNVSFCFFQTAGTEEFDGKARQKMKKNVRGANMKQNKDNKHLKVCTHLQGIGFPLSRRSSDVKIQELRDANKSLEVHVKLAPSHGNGLFIHRMYIDRFIVQN